MKAEVAQELLEVIFKVLAYLITICFIAAWTIITAGLFVHLFKFAWSAFT